MRRDELPNITITAHDAARLDILTGFAVRCRTQAQETLARELRRARIVSVRALPPDTISMHSTVRYRDEASGAVRTATLVYPGEEGSDPGRISILSPVGAALIGISVGQSIDYEDARGAARRLSVLELLFQPEAHDPSARRESRPDEGARSH
jgi:regulator of nucleoside diphosphate kinase